MALCPPSFSFVATPSTFSALELFLLGEWTAHHSQQGCAFCVFFSQASVQSEDTVPYFVTGAWSSLTATKAKLNAASSALAHSDHSAAILTAAGGDSDGATQLASTLPLDTPEEAVDRDEAPQLGYQPNLMLLVFDDLGWADVGFQVVEPNELCVPAALTVVVLFFFVFLSFIPFFFLGSNSCSARP